MVSLLSELEQRWSTLLFSWSSNETQAIRLIMYGSFIIGLTMASGVVASLHPGPTMVPRQTRTKDCSSSRASLASLMPTWPAALDSWYSMSTAALTESCVTSLDLPEQLSKISEDWESAYFDARSAHTSEYSAYRQACSAEDAARVDSLLSSESSFKSSVGSSCYKKLFGQPLPSSSSSSPTHVDAKTTPASSITASTSLPANPTSSKSGVSPSFNLPSKSFIILGLLSLAVSWL